MGTVRAIAVVGVVDVVFLSTVAAFAALAGLTVEASSVAIGVAFVSVIVGVVYFLWYHPI